MKLKVLIFVCLVLSSVVGFSHGGSLVKNFYKKSCRRAEAIVKEVTEENVANNPNLPAKLLRMHFHDCFVRGCDGSVLLSSTESNTAEKDAVPNQSLAGFDVIDAIKEKVEKECPGIVSCADILALAARDSVTYKFKKPTWDVLTGRRDGTVSLISEALLNIPSPSSNFTKLKNTFARKGLNVHHLVVLSGGHTIGVAHCNFFSDRLYNFTGKGDQDPSLDSNYAEFLKSKCSPNDAGATTVEIDNNSSLDFDTNFYKILKENKGLFQSDAALLTNKVARNTVGELVDRDTFFKEFAQSMKTMGAIEVLTGTAGEIRNKCSAVNS
ncbi:peroxidase 3 [Morus notabilis]|uniref:peroxidase 3 n=1 Tax=Morus notabilis TaxID=981085 RepID=UPI000CED36D2|nr:peroxidase 3 [Morus notabilis]